MEDHLDYYYGGVVLPGDEFFICGTRSGPITRGRVYDWRTKVELRAIENGDVVWSHDGQATDRSTVTLSPDGRIIVSCANDKILFVEAATGDLLRSITIAK